MKERPHPVLTGAELWPVIEARWPNAIWLSPWAFAGDQAEADQPADDERDRDLHVRH